MPPAKHQTIRFLSGHGALCILSAAFFLAEGLYRGELAAAVCGAAFLTYAVFALFGVLAGALTSRHIAVSPEWLRPGTLKIHHTPPSRARKILGFFCETSYSGRFSTDPARPESRGFTVFALLSADQTIAEGNVPPRGRYYCAEQAIQIRDYARFFSITLNRTVDEGFRPLTVPVVPETPFPAVMPEGKSGCARGKSTFRRSEELYESRPYSPGDDPRKINWKLFAHTGTLSLRQGELLPPPANELVVFFNTVLSEQGGTARKWSATEARFDSLVARAAYICETLLRQKKNLIIHTMSPDGKSVRTRISGDTPYSRSILLDTLAAPQPGQDQPDFFRNPALAAETETCLLFTLPDQNLDTHSLLPVRDRLTVYVGPQRDYLPAESFFSKVKSMLYIRGESGKSPREPVHSHDLSKTVTVLNEAGIHAAKI